MSDGFRGEDVLGERDPLDVLRQTEDDLPRLIDETNLAVLHKRPEEGKWTPTEILGHLVDHEITTACRIRTTRFDKEAWLSSYDQETWVAKQKYNDKDPKQLIQRFKLLRNMNIEQYESLSPEELSRPHQRMGGGEVTLSYLLKRHAAHDLIHLDQLDRYIKANRA